MWRYKTRSGESGSVLHVLKVEEVETLGIVVHIAVDGIRLRNPRAPEGFSRGLPHMPFSPSVLDESVIGLLREKGPLPDYQAGYDRW